MTVPSTLYPGFDDIIMHKGRAYRVEVDRDDDMGPPWEEHDGHGPVSDWTTRDKRPGELVLGGEEWSRGGVSRRFYDFAEACRIARRDGWGWLPFKLTITPDTTDRPAYAACGGWAEAGPFRAYDPLNFNTAIRNVYRMHRETMTARQYAAQAAMRDYEHLKAWCDDRWQWAGVKVTDMETGKTESLWGIEDSEDGEYLAEVAEELIDTLADDAEDELTAWRETQAEAMAADIAASRPDLAPAYV